MTLRPATRAKLALLTALLATVGGLGGGLALAPRLKAVEAVTLFFSGVAAGTSLVAAVAALRAASRSKTESPTEPPP